jgi:hypothetical protein
LSAEGASRTRTVVLSGLLAALFWIGVSHDGILPIYLR